MPDESFSGTVTPAHTTTSTTTTQTSQENCQIQGVSIRAWIALGLCFTVCATHLLVTIATLVEAVMTRNMGAVGSQTTVGEPLYSLSIAAVAFYFGNAVKQQSKV